MDITDPQYKSKDGSALRIWKDPAQNKFLSEREKRPIFDEVIFVEVISPGSRDSTPVFELVRNYAPEMGIPEPAYGAKYAEYKEFVDDFEKGEQGDASMAGTPLSQWQEMSRTLAATLKAQNVFTVEALAALPDTKLNVVGPDGRTWRSKAAAFIEAAAGSGAATRLAGELEIERVEKADLKRQVEELAATVAKLQADAAKGDTGHTAASHGRHKAAAAAPAPEPATTIVAPDAVFDPLAPVVAPII